MHNNRHRRRLREVLRIYLANSFVAYSAASFGRRYLLCLLTNASHTLYPSHGSLYVIRLYLRFRIYYSLFLCLRIIYKEDIYTNKVLYEKIHMILIILFHCFYLIFYCLLFYLFVLFILLFYDLHYYLFELFRIHIIYLFINNFIHKYILYINSMRKCLKTCSKNISRYYCCQKWREYFLIVIWHLYKATNMWSS